MSSHIFICYAHDDAEVVRQDVGWLSDQGYSIFFDERIHGGAEWAQELADAIDECQLLLFIASAKSIKSPHCLNEIAYAVDVGKPVLTVFREPLELQKGLKLTISRTQAIVRWQLREEEYYRQLTYALNMYTGAGLLPDAAGLPEKPQQIWLVPLHRNAGFSGRDDALELIDKQLNAGEKPVAIALTGQAGVGKTQLALEYTYRYARTYQTVAWIRAEDSATLDADFVALGSRLGLTDANEVDTPLVVDAVRDWLAEDDQWFLILDNSESPDVIRRYLPREIKGRLLITSRRQTWGRLATSVPVELFGEQEAVTFLLERTSQDDAACAAKLANTLGYLPLALEESAAYIESTGRSLSSYLALFNAHHDVLMSSSEPTEDYQRTLRTTLEVSVEQLEADEPNAATLLRHIAFLAPDDIQTSILDAIDLPTPADTPAEITADKCITTLARYALIKVGNDSVSTHRLTQLVIRDCMTNDEADDFAAATLSVIAGLFPRVTDIVGESAAACRRLLPHALATLAYAKHIPSAAVAAGTLLGRTGTYMSARNLSHESSTQLAQAYQIFRDQPEHRRMYARTCELYARILYANGSLEHARQIFSEALPLFEAEGPTSLLHRGGIHLDLAWVQWTQGEFSDALESAQRSLQLIESVLGPAAPLRAISLSMISRIELDVCNTARAREIIEDVVSAIPDIPPVDVQRTPLLCAVFLQTAQVLRYLGSPLRARSWAQESLLLGQPVFSEHHTLMGASHCVFGQALMDLEEYETARSELEAAAECAERNRFPVNQHVFIGVCLLALTLIELGETDEASRLINSRMNDLDKQIAGETAHASAYVSLARGWLAHRCSDFTEASVLCESGDQTIADRYGEHSAYRLYPLTLLANCLARGDRIEEAKQTHQLALTVADQNGLAIHPLRARHLEALADLADLERDHGRASSLRGDALSVYHTCLGPSSEPVSRVQAILQGD